MKITFVVSGSVRSNFSYRPLALAKSLHARGHEVSLVAPKADKYNDFTPEVIMQLDGVRILQPFQFITKRVELNFLPYLVSAALLVLREKPDVVYIYKPTPVSIIGLVARLRGVTSVIADFDDLGSEVMRIEGHPLYQRVLVAWSEWTAARYADRLVVASKYLYEMYRNQFPTKPILSMPNGADSSWFDAVIPTSHPKRIVFMGSINRKNILEPLFDALPSLIKKNPELEVTIIGAGSFLERFKDTAEFLGIDAHVQFLGWLPLEQAKAHLQSGDIGYSYMSDEITTRAASNMKVPQYMARGVVPFVSDVGDLAASVEYGDAGYVCMPDDADSFQKTLEQALIDTDRKKKAEVARNHALHKKNWDTLASDFETWITSPKLTQPSVYVVATTLPGNVGGGELRNYHLIKQLIKRHDAKITLFCIAEYQNVARYIFRSLNLTSESRAATPHVRSWFSATYALLAERVPPFMIDFHDSGLGDEFRRACEVSLPDIVHIEQLYAYYCVRKHIPWLKSRGVKIVFDCHNIEFLAFKDSLVLFSKAKALVGWYLIPNLKRLEIEATRRADLVLTCSPHEYNFFKKYNTHTILVQNGVDCAEFENIDTVHSPTLIFIGGVGYPPNADAVEFYLRNIHSYVQKVVPKLKVLLVGCDKTWVHSLGFMDNSIHALGFVDDIRPHLLDAAIGICPIRHGAGTRIKIMTYMAAGLPVVSTRKGAEGVGYTDGENILLADEPEAFTESILKLLQDDEYRKRLADQGRDFICQNYDWNVLGKDLEAAYQRLYSHA